MNEYLQEMFAGRGSAARIKGWLKGRSSKDCDLSPLLNTGDSLLFNVSQKDIWL